MSSFRKRRFTNQRRSHQIVPPWWAPKFAIDVIRAHGAVCRIYGLVLVKMEDTEDRHTLANAVVDTVRDSLLVLDGKLNVVAASRSFYSTFLTTPDATIGRRIYDLGNGEWNNTTLQQLLERIVPEHGVMDHFELEQEFGHLGQRNMLLNARKVFYKNDDNSTLLLAIEDVTDRRNSERLLKVLSNQKDTLLSEMSHRVANSLQIIASILLLKAHSVKSEETRGHLEDAHRRVMSVASLQQQLKASGNGEKIDVGEYLKKLCDTLAGSMITEKQPITLNVVADLGLVQSEWAVSFGLIVTELVINAIKHAFPNQVSAGHIDVTYHVAGEDWVLKISDNGCGMPAGVDDMAPGLGTAIVKALAQQLDAHIVVDSSSRGTSVSIVHNASQIAAPRV
jgi:two-component sensor histidine kinase